MPKFNDLSALLLKEAIDSGITSISELTSLMANASVETWHFTTMHEKLNYSSVKNVIRAVYSADDRFTVAQIQAAIDSKDPKQIATILYEGRSKEDDLGNTEPGDGAKYYGRGYFQYTGRIRYAKYGEKFGVDLVNHPDQAAEPKMAAKLAVAYWRERVAEENRHDARLAGEDINGGENGATERAAAQKQWAETITPQLIKDIQTGKITLDQLSFHGWNALKDGKLNPDERGMEIRELQHHLNDLAIADAKGRQLEPNGTFDKPTQQAVATFQRQLGLSEKSPVTADTLKAAAFYAGAPEIMRRPLLNPQSVLSHTLQEDKDRMPPGSPPSYRTDWMQRDADGTPNYLHESATTTVPFKAAEERNPVGRSSAPALPSTELHTETAPVREHHSGSLHPADFRGAQTAAELNPVLAQLTQLQNQMAALQQQMQHGTPEQIDIGRRSPSSIGDTTPSMPLPNNRRHPDFPLFDAIRRQLPPGTSDEMAAHVTLQAKIGGVDSIDEFRHVTLRNGHAFVIGRTPGDDAKVDLSMTPPPLQETLQQSSAFDRQQSLHLAQIMEQQRQINERGGPGLSL